MKLFANIFLVCTLFSTTLLGADIFLSIPEGKSLPGWSVLTRICAQKDNTVLGCGAIEVLPPTTLKIKLQNQLQPLKEGDKLVLSTQEKAIAPSVTSSFYTISALAPDKVTYVLSKTDNPLQSPPSSLIVGSQLIFSRLNGVSVANGAKASLASNPGLGLRFDFSKTFSRKWTFGLSSGLLFESYKGTDTVTLLHPNGVSSIWAFLYQKVSPNLAIKPIVGMLQSLHFLSEEGSVLTIDRSWTPFLGSSLVFYTALAPNTRLFAEGGAFLLMPASKDLYNSNIGYQIRTRVFTIRTVSDSGIAVGGGFHFDYWAESTTLTTESRTDGGLEFTLFVPFKDL